ncbi:DHH family phosphoesterase [Streptococcus sp. DD13]|uniref:DHH family phosphoesterase n=1 Tax=Streptococcus sp. DD13 TaxID=1777881 RepID=UPI0007979288|nr:bifunctional oligoribonuclease/PAP phosphatase NrnA [Streptococcus sp. DD13]KXT78524.1 3'-to-5' oligoribonuclease A [Streptococcus sp. DD13]
MSVLKEIFHKIKEYDRIVIHRHQRPDPDAIGSQVGLARILQERFPEKEVRVVGATEPSLRWMAEMDVVADAFYQGALVIVTDTANQPRIDDDRYQQGDFLIKIDHHPNDDPYGDLRFVQTTASSCSEIITQFARELDLVIPNEAARLLYAGMVGDTGRFLYPSTTTQTFEAAAYLRSLDFDFAGLSRQMDSMDIRIAKLTGYVYDHMEVDENGTARVVITRDLMESYQLTEAETSAIVAAPGRIDTVRVWAIFVEQEDGRSYRVRIRSKFAPINQVAKRHDGGGHPLASGANSFSVQENELIYQELQEVAAHACQQ